MGNEATVRATGDWDIRGADLRAYYAGFARRVLPDGAIWRLSLAQSCLPAGHIGYRAWLTLVSGTERFVPEMQEWAIGLGQEIARMKPRLRTRAREYVPSYREDWGRQASLDGLGMAILGKDKAPSISSRATEFGCDWNAYQRIRDFVAGSVALGMWQYEDALRWAHKVARDA